MNEVEIEDVQKELEKDIEMGKKMVEDGKKLVDEGKAKLKISREKIKDLGDGASEKLKEFEKKHHQELENIVKESEKVVQEAEIFIRKYPMLGVFSAFSFGYIMGKLTNK